jgi:hypothetical protein
MYTILAGKPEKRRLLSRPRHGLEDIIKMDLEEIIGEDVDWINLV